MKTTFLDFDGVLHALAERVEKKFCRVYLLEELATEFSFDIVVSSTWRLFNDISVLKYQLKSVGERVVGVTGQSISGPFARYKEILRYVDENKVKEWRALDDAQMEFPTSETRLLSCETDKGLGNSQIILLKDWLAGSRQPHDITQQD